MINCCFFEHTCTKLFVSLTQTWNLVNKTTLKWVNKDPIYFTSSFEMFVIENIFQKWSILVTQKKNILNMLENFSGIQHCWCDRINQLCHIYIIAMQSGIFIYFLYFVTLSCNVFGGGTWTVSGMDKNTENLLSLILLLYWNFSMPNTQRCVCFPDKNLNFWT